MKHNDSNHSTVKTLWEWWCWLWWWWYNKRMYICMVHNIYTLMGRCPGFCVLTERFHEEGPQLKKVMFKNICLFIWSKHLTSIIQLSSQEKPKILHTNKKYLRFTTFYEHLLHIQTPTYGTNISHYCSSWVNIFSPLNKICNRICAR